MFQKVPERGSPPSRSTKPQPSPEPWLKIIGTQGDKSNNRSYRLPADTADNQFTDNTTLTPGCTEEAGIGNDTPNYHARPNYELGTLTASLVDQAPNLDPSLSARLSSCSALDCVRPNVRVRASFSASPTGRHLPHPPQAELESLPPCHRIPCVRTIDFSSQRKIF